MTDFVISLIRTWVPIGVGAFLAWLFEFGLDLYSVEGELTVAITGVLAAVYYFAVRVAAEKWPAVGVLLGYNKAPAYNEPA